MQVFAEEVVDEEASSEGTGYDSVTNNVAELESNIQNSYKAASTYDIGMQYLVTYNILKDGYLKSNGSYADIYSKDVSSGTFSGKGSSVVSKVKTGATNVYDAASGKESNIDLDNDGNQAEDASAEKKEAAADAMAGILASQYKKSIDKFFATDDTIFTTLDGDPNGFVYFFHSNKPTKAVNIAGKNMPVGLVKSKDSKAPKVPKTASDAMTKALKEYFKIQIKTSQDTSGLESSIKLTNAKFKQTIFNPSNKGKETNYFTHYQKALNDKFNYNWNDVSAMQVNPIQLVATLSNGDKLSTKDKLAKLKNIHRYSGLTTHKGGTKSFETMVNAALKADLASVNKNSDFKTALNNYKAAADVKDFETVNTNGIRTLAWTPLAPYYSSDIADLDAWGDFETALTEGGIKTSSATSDYLKVLDSNGKDRAAQLGDIFFDGANNASPVFIGPATNKDAKDMARVKVGYLDIDKGISGTSIGNFIGVKADTGWPILHIGAEFKKMGTDDFNSSKSVARGTLRAITASGEYKKYSNNKSPLGIDNYGNVIVGETGQILIPYWHNTLYLNNLNSGGNNAYVTHPIYGSDTGNKLTEFLDGVLSNATAKELSITSQAIVDSGLISDAASIDKTMQTAQTYLSSDNTLSVSRVNELMSGVGGNKEDNLKVLAMIITAGTTKSVKEWNTTYIDLAMENKQMYVGLTAGGFISGGSDEESQMERWTAASLIQKIGLVFDWGFAETLRLTVASGLVSFYNSNLASTGLTNIFYTPNITETSEWSSMLEPLALLLLAFTPIYIIYMLFQANRGRATAKDIVKQFVMLSLILLIPISGYGAFTSLLLNKPAEMVLGNQLKQTIVMDFYLDSKEQTSNTSSAYSQLFGTANTNNKFRTSDNYILEFYTTTDKNGFIIDDFDDADNLLDDMRQQAFTRGNDWNKNRLVSINVSLFDLFEWGTKRARGTMGEENGTTLTLFDWLEEDNPDAYSGVGDYQEYYVDTSTIFDNNVNGVVKDVKGTTVTASSLFSDLMLAGRQHEDGGNENPVRKGLESLNELMVLFSQTNEDYVDSSGVAYYQPTAEDIHSVMRDLSMIGSTRKTAFGTSKYSLFTQNVMANGTKSDRYNLAMPVNIPDPKNDIFGIYDTVSYLNPYLKSGQATSWMDQESIESMVYDINYDVLTDLATVYSMIPNATGLSAENTDMGSALQMTTVSEIFFRLNDELGFKNFPTSYDPGTVSTDNYLKMVYIPFAEYGLDRADFANSDVMTNDVAEYIALRESSFILILFIVAVLALVLYGLFMLAIFYGLMMVLTIYSFVKNYIIKNDYKNKSWLGVLGIYTVLGLVKFGLILVWYVMTSILNSQYLDNGGASYSYMMIHSLVIIAYLAVVSKFVIAKLFTAVYKDKDNLGGEAFSNGLASMRDRAMAKTSFSSGRTRPMGNVAGNASKKFKDMAKGTGKFAKGAGKLAKGAGVLSAGAGIAVGSRVHNKLKQQKEIEGSAVSLLSNKIASGKRKYHASKFGGAVDAAGNRVKGFGRGIKDAGFAVTHPFQAFHNYKQNNKKMGFKNNAHKSIVGNSIEHLGGITKAVNGVASTAVSVADTVGKVYDVKNKATATVLTMGSVAGAKALVDGLSKAGYAVKSDGKNVVVDSSALDLSTVEGRAALVDAGVENIQNKAENYDYSVKDTRLTGQQGTPVLFGQDNGAYNLLFDNSSGLSTKYYQKMLQNKEFNDNFIVDKSSVETHLDGSVKPNSMIKVIPRNNNMSQSSVQNIFKNLYNEDTQFRAETNGVPERKQGSYNVMDLSELPKTQMASYMKDAPVGVMLQGSQLFYNNKNHEQINYAQSIQDNVLLEKRTRQQELVRDRDSIINYMRDGEGHGVMSKTLSSDKDPAVATIFGDTLAEHSVAFNVGDSNTSQKVQSYVNTIKSLGNVTNQDRQSFSNIQNVLRSKGDEVLLQNGGLNAVEKSIGFLQNTSNVKNTPALQSIIATKELIDQDVDSGKLTKESADKHYTQLYKKVVHLADDSNRLDDLYLREVKDVDTKVQDNYTTIKDTISRKYNIPNDDIDRVRWGADNFESYKDAFGEIKDFKVEGNVGRISSKDGVNQEKVSKLVAKAAETDFKDKDYSIDYKPKSTKDVVNEPQKTKKPNVVKDAAKAMQEKLMKKGDI